MPGSSRIAQFGDYRLDYSERLLHLPRGQRAQLSRRLFDTLCVLLEYEGRLVPKSELMRRVWGNVVVEDNTLGRTISSLRQLLADSSGSRCIGTVSGLGYRMLLPVSFRNADPKATGTPAPCIAVLPFEDLCEGRDERAFTIGIVEELTTVMARLAGVRTVSSASAYQLCGRGAREASERLGATHVFTGAVRSEGTQLRVLLQLVQTTDEQPVWGTRCDGDVAARFALQEAVSRAALEGLRSVLGLRAPNRALARVPDPEAYDLHLRARVVALATGGPAIVQAYELQKQVVNRDPDFAVGWVQLAVYVRQMLIFGVPATAEMRQDIVEAAARTRALEPESWPALQAELSLHHLNLDWLRCERSLSAAEALAAGLPAELRLEFVWFYFDTGQIARSLPHLRDEVRNDPLSLFSCCMYQLALLLAGDYGTMEVEYRRSLTLIGNRDLVEHLMLHRLWAQGLPFRDQFRRYLSHQSTSLPVLQQIEAMQDKSDDVVQALRAALHEPVYAPPARQLILAWWLAAYGARDAAMDVMWRVYVEDRHLNTSWLWFPVFAPLRRLPRFRDLLEKTGLTAYWTAAGCGPDEGLLVARMGVRDTGSSSARLD